MKSKNVKSVSYAKGPKPSLFKDCSIVEMLWAGQLLPFGFFGDYSLGHTAL
jgi:hypothetical protein